MRGIGGALSRRAAVVAVAAGLAIGGVTAATWANHYHSYNFTNHGLVHGSSTSDGSFHSRVDSDWLAYAHCLVGVYSTALSEEVRYGGDCNAWSWDYGSQWMCESRGWSYVEVTSGVLSWHRHDAHIPADCA